MNSAQKDHVKTKIFGLSVQCPFSGTNPCVCPLHEIRKKGLRERLEWAERLSETEALNILTFHQKCLEEKEGAQR